MINLDQNKIDIALGYAKLDEVDDSFNVKQNTTSTSRRREQEKVPNSRWHSLVSYMSLENIESFLKSAPFIKRWCYTYHDKDIESDGTPKPPHTHILLYTFSSKTSSAVRKKFDNYSKQVTPDGEIPQNTLGQIAYDPMVMYRYQLHLDDKDKYQYPKECRQYSDVYWWREFEGTDGRSGNIALEIYDSIKAGMSTRDLLINYGCEFSHNQNNYRSLFYQGEYENAHIKRTVDEFKTFFYEQIKDIVQDSPFCELSRREFMKIFDYVSAVLQVHYSYDINFKEKR